MTLGERLKEHRKNSGLSQEKVAEIIGVSRQAVTKWEADQSSPSSENLIALASLFHTSLDELVANDIQRKNKSNLILRSNLTLLAISFQAGALHACTQDTSYRNLSTGVELPDHGAFIFKIVILMACSLWMTRNLMYEKDVRQRNKNIRIELFYCLIQLIIALFTRRFNMGLVGALLTIMVLLYYILVINPKYMNRKFTKDKAENTHVQ